jgi:hypothetical protein
MKIKKVLFTMTLIAAAATAFAQNKPLGACRTQKV